MEKSNNFSLNSKFDIYNCCIGKILDEIKPLDKECKENVKNYLAGKEKKEGLYVSNNRTYTNFILRSKIGKDLYKRYKSGSTDKFSLENVLELIGNCEQEIIDMVTK